MTALKKEQRCQDLVEEQWKDRQEDLLNPELRGYVNEHGELHRLEYWYLDWFDGASIQVQQDAAAWSQMQGMIG